MCVNAVSLLLRCGALTCSHHKQQSHHQSKEKVHLHFASVAVLCAGAGGSLSKPMPV